MAGLGSRQGRACGLGARRPLTALGPWAVGLGPSWYIECFPEVSLMTMLDRMRRHKGWLKWSLGLVAAAMAVFLIPTDFLGPTTTTTVGASPGETIAEVDGRELTAGDFQQRYYSQIQAYRNQFGGNINDQLLRQFGIDQQILTQMIDEQVALIEADRHGITVSDDELAQQIFSIPGLQDRKSVV